MTTYQFQPGVCCGCRKHVRDLPSHSPQCAALDDALGWPSTQAVRGSLTTGCAVEGCHRRRMTRKNYCKVHYQQRVNDYRRAHHRPRGHGPQTVTCACGRAYVARCTNKKLCDECHRLQGNANRRRLYAQRHPQP